MKDHTLVTLGVTAMILALIGGLSFENSGGTAEAASAYNETFKTPQGTTVRLTCENGTLIATTEPFTNQFGVGAGDIAAASGVPCDASERVRAAGDITDGTGTITAYRYCRGPILIVTTPTVLNQIGVTGGSVALAPFSRICR
ncbi:MAG TPA: hypothetical protein VD862_03275 [Candidatus Paceibacterota bacterium]|nr:hypothetical protein [Candidatus Paceibacterota bacterium]